MQQVRVFVVCFVQLIVRLKHAQLYAKKTNHDTQLPEGKGQPQKNEVKTPQGPWKP